MTAIKEKYKNYLKMA